MFTVEVKTGGEYTTHSTHHSYKDAVDQADMVRGRVVCDPELIEQLSIASHRDEAGCHFTQWLDWQALEMAGLITVDRPIHHYTKIPYDQMFWTFDITEAGQEAFSARPSNA